MLFLSKLPAGVIPLQVLAPMIKYLVAVSFELWMV